MKKWNKLIHVFLSFLIILLAGCSGKKEIKKNLPPPDYKLLEIISRDVITRGNLAYIFESVFQGSGNEINFVVRRGFMEKLPDGKFYPQDTVKRFQFAILITRILFTLPDMPVPDTIPEMKDIDYNYFARRAIQLVVGLHIMRLRKDKFYPNLPLSGAEALYSIKKLKGIME